MIKLTAITSGKNISTTRFRIQQYVEPLKKSDIGFAPKNDIEWYDALKYLYDNDDKCNDFGKNGRKIVGDNYEKKENYSLR